MNKSVAIKKYMTTAMITLTEDMEVTEASLRLVKHGISGAPVLDRSGKLCGILTERDCFKVTLNAGYYSEPGGKVGDYMSRNIETVAPDASIFELAELFVQKKYRRYPVVENEKLIGMISRRDILKALLQINQKQ